MSNILCVCVCKRVHVHAHACTLMHVYIWGEKLQRKSWLLGRSRPPPPERPGRDLDQLSPREGQCPTSTAACRLCGELPVSQSLWTVPHAGVDLGDVIVFKSFL
jgi:hypothetical protein